MTLVIDVPRSTVLADLDETLRELLTRELRRHDIEGVEIAFDAPSRAWAGKLTAPTVNLFLYDLPPAVERTELTREEHRGIDGTRETPPPLRLEVRYAVTAWTNAVEDEHRLLSQVLMTLACHRTLPSDLGPRRPDGAGPRIGEAQAAVGRMRDGKADFWTSVGGDYKASIDYTVHLTIQPGPSIGRGPEVRTATVRAGTSSTPGSTLEELHTFAGTVRDATGTAVAAAAVELPDAGLRTETRSDGSFRLARVRAGTHRLVVRPAVGEELVAQALVPGGSLDLVLVAAGPRAGTGRRRGR